MYAGLADGVCMSPNAGETWTDISSGLSNTDIRALAVAPDGKVYCGTWGDGVYRLTESGLAVPASSLPKAYLLAQNYPNPFNPSTTIKYELPKSSIVRLSVFDMLGREVAMLVNERRESGVYEVKFDGSGLASGVYLYRVKAGDFVQSRKLLLLR